MANGSRSDAGAVSLFVVIITLVFLFVWPGSIRYQYSFRDKGLVRIDRLNGNVSTLVDGKYRTVDNIDENGIGLSQGEK